MKQTRAPALFFLFTFLLVLLPPSLAAFAQEVSFPIDRYNYPTQMAHMAGSLYVVTGDNDLYMLDTDNQSLLMCKALPKDLVFLQGPELMALDINSGTIYRFDKAGDAMTYSAHKQLNLDDLKSMKVGEILKCTVTADLLCLMVGRYDVSEETSVYAFDMDSGRLIPGRIMDVSDMCAYQPGKILILRSLDEEILTADPRTMQTKMLMDAPDAYSLNGLAYDDDSGTISVLSDMVVYASCQGMPFEERGYVDIDTAFIWACMPNGDTYAVLHPKKQLSVCDFKGFENARSVRMIGGSPSRVLISDYFQANKSTPVVYDRFTPANYVAMTMLYSPDDADIFILPTNSGILGGILDEGYALDLSQADAVSIAVADMYPDIREKVTKDGKIYGLPISMECRMLGYNSQLFADLYLKVPDTWPDLMDLMIQLAQREDICLADSPFGKASASDLVLDLMLDAYLNAASDGISGIKYDPAIFHSLLEKWEELDSVLDRVGERPAKEGQRALFMADFYSWLRASSGRTAGYSALPLAFLAGGEKYAPASVSVMMINSATENSQEALRFLAFYAQNLPAYDRIALYPNENTPAASSYIAKSIEESEQIITQLEQQQASSTGEEQAQLQGLLDFYRNSLQYMRERAIIITPEDIADYRKMDGNMTFGLTDAGYIYKDKMYDENLQLFRDHSLSSKSFCFYMTYRWSNASLTH